MEYGLPSSSQAAPIGYPNAQPQKFCAYNQSRRRFLSANVEVADFSPTVLQDRLPVLAESIDFALWHLPFRGISPTHVCEPIDLVYLDEECQVLETVESFPLAQVSPSSRPAASVLVLKADSIVSSSTQLGDRLVLCGAEEMKRRLKQVAKEHSHESVARLAELSNLFSTIDLSKGIPSRSKPFIVDPSATAQIATQASGLETNAESYVANVRLTRNWLERLFGLDPWDPRRARRESLEWLVAYYFTGSAPAPSRIRDVGLTGIYIYTEERWSPGSILRLTLTDSRDPSPERSMTLNAKVIRWGNDGVGFKFVLKNPKAAKARRGQYSLEDQVEGVSKEEIAQFLNRIRTEAN